jgi:hypothetical protein
MKAEELRIGNLIKWDSTGDIEKVVKIGYNNVNNVHESDLQPIPLTEEWLAKFGFRPLNDHEFSLWVDEWECLSLYAEPYPKSFVIGLSRGLKDIWNKSNIQNLHQLQNLYFALTGQELTIK